jgi:hypothetical protein
MCRGYKIQVDDELGFTMRYAKITLEYVKSLIILPTLGSLGLINSSTHRKKRV